MMLLQYIPSMCWTIPYKEYIGIPSLSMDDPDVIFAELKYKGYNGVVLLRPAYIQTNCFEVIDQEYTCFEVIDQEYTTL